MSSQTVPNTHAKYGVKPASKFWIMYLVRNLIVLTLLKLQFKHSLCLCAFSVSLKSAEDFNLLLSTDSSKHPKFSYRTITACVGCPGPPEVPISLFQHYLSVDGHYFSLDIDSDYSLNYFGRNSRKQTSKHTSWYTNIYQ